ncbi:MAG: molybdenum ABC transporter ATP-binding protein [Prolixibacteraceae bacterium]|jgi:molybdate transport system ATP-binding protein|nr:molybdenum ABC transporter ATP-binding protein [Prolixibacteraceae bacterium]
MNEILHIDLSYKRGNFALKMNLSIPEGITGVFGPSGSGKSTLLKLISGIETPDEGVIELNGKELFNKNKKQNLPLRKRRIGLVFQEGRLFPHMNVRKNLLYGYSEKSRFNFDEVVDLLEIRDLLEKRPDDCSGGEKQRIAIGRMLLHSPELLLLDEPFSALDQRLRHNIIPFLLKITKKFGLPVIVVSHDLSDLLMLSDQLVLVDGGQIKGVGSYFDLIMNGENPCCLHQEPVVNSIQVEVKSIVHQNEILSFSYNSGWPDNLLTTENIPGIGTDARLFFNLFPEDVSLSLSRLEGISAQNQLEGKLLQMKPDGRNRICRVDVGFQVLVRITARSVEKLNLEEGRKVFCLFKTSAIKNLFPVSS